MKTNYKLKRLCGSYYGYPVVSNEAQWKGSNIVYDGNTVLITAALNRIQVMDLTTVSVRTLPVEARSNIACIAVSGPLLVAVDVQNYALLIHLHRGVVLHRTRFAHRVQALEFYNSNSNSTTHNGTHQIAVATGKLVQIWSLLPAATRTVAPWQLERTLTGCADRVECLAWSPDGSVVAAGARDGSVHIWTRQTTRHFVPVTLSAHKTAIVGLYFVEEIVAATAMPGAHTAVSLLCSVSADGAVVTWGYAVVEGTIQVREESTMMQDDDDDADFFATTGTSRPADARLLAERIVGARWTSLARKYFQQEGGATSSVTSTSIANGLLAVGYSTGVFGLYELPDLANIHTLSVGSNQLIQACKLNSSGDWLALACPASQQVLVWEWQSETYVLKHRGHAYGMRCLAYAPDGVCVATGGEDGKIKVWNSMSGLCYVTMDAHTAPITAIQFANASVLITASLDGTVKAHDLHRYRTFRTFTTPTPTQFLSLAVDSAGEIVAAGTIDPFHIYTWSLQTGRPLDILVGHTGPVCGLTFQPQAGVLASASWDGTVRTWNLYAGTNIPVESFQHATDVVCVAFRPDGKHICSGTIGGVLSIWDVESGKLMHEIDGRKDVRGGRKLNDRMTAANNASSRYFTSVCYSADGTCVLAGGNSKFVCIYEVSQQILLRKYQVSHNRSLDGILDKLNSKNLGEGGPIDDEDDTDDDGPFNAAAIPGARRGDDGSRKSKVEVLTRHVSFSPTGREWALVSGEGLHVYSLDEDMVFDPISLTESITPAAVQAKLVAQDFGLALRMALHLNEFELIRSVLEDTPYKSIPHVVRSIGPEQLERLLQCLGKIAEASPHLEFYLQWCLQLLQTHGLHLEKHRGTFMRAFRALHKVWATKHGDLNNMCNDNRYTLAFVQDHGTLMDKLHGQEEQEKMDDVES